MTEASPATIYVVEDDAEVSRVLMRTLDEFGFAAQAFRDGASVLRRLQTERPDLCAIDLGLPDMDGMELVREIARRWGCGMLIITGRGHLVDRIMGLEGGGDDYLVKPFEAREVVARVRSILRRRATGITGVPTLQRRYARFAGWTMDCAANTLRGLDGSEQLLGSAEAQVLRSFLESPRQILTREQLLGSRDVSPFDRSIDVRISRLRRKLEADPQNPQMIKTVYGAGYMFSAVVNWS